jgi:hypothetical protein
VETPVALTCLSVDCPESKTDGTVCKKKRLYIESSARYMYKHNMQMKLEKILNRQGELMMDKLK